MKINLLFCVCSICLVTTAFSQSVLSLHPLFTEQDAVLISGLEGRWHIPDFDMEVSLQKSGDNFYVLKYGSRTAENIFEAVFLNINHELYLDLTGVLMDSVGDEDYRNSFITAHSFYKVRIDQDTLQLFEMNYAWLYNYAKNSRMPFQYEWIKNDMLLTCNTDELQTLVNEHKNDPEFFGDPLSLISHHAEVKEKRNLTSPTPAVIASPVIQPTCIPHFPFKDGWLGGDGDVSVPINATTTLFIFSDTYVGAKNQTSRMEPGMGMVSNTVAVETCLSNGETHVQYFWNNMHAENPEPVFKTYTDRYRYWVPDAFMIHNNLYVLLEKVGTKQGAAPNELFNFSLLGYTLAKISNPAQAPDQWDIEYIPLPDFKNPTMAIASHAILDNYLYFFISRHDKAQVLVRKPLDLIDHTEKPFEYYSLSKTWEEGLNQNQMDTIIHGFRSTTVNYHPEMMQWVMICDIYFMDNKIKMRTAPALTGPWSDEITIYEIPEVTPGTPEYTESNFCYLPRECIQNYNAQRHEMLLTYDINNSDYSKINANSKIYTPKVITIPLK